MRFRTKLARLALAASVVVPSTLGALALSANTASAVGCYGDYCSGQDPQATGCANDAQTVAPPVNGGDFILELRWSPTCQTNWARLSLAYSIWPYMGTLSAIQNYNGYTQSAGVPDSGTYWTPMIYSPVLCVKAQFVVSGMGINDQTACV